MRSTDVLFPRSEGLVAFDRLVLWSLLDRPDVQLHDGGRNRIENRIGDSVDREILQIDAISYKLLLKSAIGLLVEQDLEAGDRRYVRRRVVVPSPSSSMEEEEKAFNTISNQPWENCALRRGRELSGAAEGEAVQSERDLGWSRARLEGAEAKVDVL